MNHQHEQQTVLLDGVTYSLDVAPPVDSPLVQHHLSTLPADVPLLSQPVGQLSRHVVALSQFDAVQRAFSELLLNVGNLNIRLCLGRLHDACASVLMQQMVTLRMIAASPFQNESLTHFNRLALTLGAFVMECVSVLQTITTCLSALSTGLRDAQHSLNSTLNTKQQTLSTLRVQNVSIMQQQSQLLQSLSEYAEQYSQLQASQQRISRRQTLCNIFSFVPSVDQSLQSSYNLHLFEPVSNIISDVNDQYNQSRRETEHVLTMKRRQRERNRNLVNELAECERHIQQAAEHINDCNQQLHHVTEAIQSAQTIGVLALRVITAFKSIAHACQTLSSSQLPTLIDLTCSPSSEKPAIRQGDLSVLDASQLCTQPTWTMKTAVKQKFVQYYAQWVALKHCCQQCLKQLSDEQHQTIPQLCWDAFDNEASAPDVPSLFPSSSAVTEHQQSSVAIESHDAEHLSVAST